MVKLPPEEQKRLMELEPDVFSPANGAWGRAGCTIVQLAGADVATVKDALQLAWKKTAPQKLLDKLEGS